MAKKSHLQVLFASVTLSAEQHPNSMKLTGTLVILDSPSDKPPNGADGHRIILPSSVAKKRLNTLIGMGFNYADDLQGHSQRRKVGVIQKAYIQGNKLQVEGVIWKKDFPEATTDLKQKNLGMSMELSDVTVEDDQAPIWTLADCMFTGATILYRDAAAYKKTLAIAAKADEGRKKMPITKKKKPGTETTTTTKLADLVAAAVGQAFSGTLNRQTKILAGLSAGVTRIDTRLTELEADIAASRGAGDDEEEEDSDEINADAMTTMPTMTTKKVKAAKKEPAKGDDDENEDEEGDDEDDDMESAGSEHGIEEGDLDDMGSELDEDSEDDDDPGHFNKGAKNKGSQTTPEDKVGKTVHSSQMRVMQKKLNQIINAFAELKAENASLKKQVKKTQKQTSIAAAAIERRSVANVPSDVSGLLQKAGVNVGDLVASGTKLTVAEVDSVIGTISGLDVVKRMEIKNKFLQAGLMDEGRVNRPQLF